MSIGRWISALPRRSLPARVAVLAAVMLGAYGCVVWAVIGRSGTIGVVAASLTVGVCLASSTVALMTSHWMGGLANGMAGMLLPMMARTGPPLFLALIVRLRGQGLVEAGFVYYLVGFYLLALALEVPMSLPCAGRFARRCDGPERNGWKPHG